MQTRTLPLKLMSPAFLGDADQKGVWRTPPLKALLREWWRVAVAPQHGYDHRAIRDTEGELFGNAWLEPDANRKSRFCQSKVRMALAHWDAGKMTALGDDLKVAHGEVKDRNTGNQRPVGSQLYLGYGPLISQQGTKLKHGAALQFGETNTLSLAYPDHLADTLDHTLQLIHWFGTMGGRCRNGWGSLAFDLEPLAIDNLRLQAVLRPLADCLKPGCDWPHAIGKDSRPLIWQSSETFPDWQKAMQFLARTKIGYRTTLRFDGGEPHPQPQERHLLAYPVTHHKVAARNWGGDARLANQLRFKLIPAENNSLRALIYHTPHRSPLPTNGLNELAVWQRIHVWLDDPQHQLVRLGTPA